uniref:hypothetical protein n=1 Tax=uncultured Dysgonomonas sp. TaxID=206096 RepID=UPI00258EC586|nr:hypothetical protein [uncultured Dysgonomonas sp.]
MTLIPIDNELKDFKKYLDSNDRCIFSARFGDGKSYFLSRFMKKHQKQYLFIPIYPVNYQVAENKDIFEYIKRDILIRLLASGEVEIDDTTISNSIYLYYYLQQNKIDVFSELLNIAPDINLNGTDISLSAFTLAIKAFDKIKDKFKEYKSKFKNDKQKAQDFLESCKKNKGSIYEFDIISQLICDLMSQYKTKYKNRRKVVLLVEDLDRIDPAHIFRILNIFSAHFDRYDISYTEVLKTQGRNKFNFDKIITVCHYENIENIYYHLYGKKADFNGYIGKFSTSNPYKYSLKDAFKDHIINQLPNSLIHFQSICNLIVNHILKQYDDQNFQAGNNLRNIDRNLKRGFNIRNECIEIAKGVKIMSKCPLTHLLCLLKHLDIDIDILDNVDIQYELIDLIDTGWFVFILWDNDISFKLLSDKKISIIVESGGYNVDLSVSLDKGILLETDLKRIIFKNKYYSPLKDTFFEQKSNIINFFQKYI